MKLIYITIEVTAREYYPKLLLSYLAAKKGYTVVLGDISKFFSYNYNYKGIFHYKDIAPSLWGLPLFEKLKKRGFKITSLDEEGGIENKEFDNKKSDSFLKLRFSEKTFQLVDKVFTWGNFDHNSISDEYKEFKDKIIITGNPRYDFCNSKLDFFFDGKKGEENNISQKPILIISDIGNVMSQKPIWDQIEIARNAYFKNDNSKNHEDEIFEISANKTVFLGEFIKLIRNLAKNFPNEKFVFRPHPTESLLAWRNLIGDYRNIHITNEKNSIHWIRKCKLMIHNSCYTALEASLLKKPIISFCPERCKNFRKDFLSKFGSQTTDFSQTKELLENFLKDNNILNENISKNFELVQERINFDEKLSAKKILDEWVNINDELNLSKIKTFSFYLQIFFIKFFYFFRSIAKKFLSFIGVKTIKHSKFEEFNKNSIMNDLENLDKENLADEEGSFIVNKFDKNLCLIKFKKKL